MSNLRPWIHLSALSFGMNKKQSILGATNRCTSFCSKQCEHQKAPYIFAPIECKCLAREIAKGLDFVVTSVLTNGRSISAKLLKRRN